MLESNAQRRHFHAEAREEVDESFDVVEGPLGSLLRHCCPYEVEKNERTGFAKRTTSGGGGREREVEVRRNDSDEIV